MSVNSQSEHRSNDKSFPQASRMASAPFDDTDATDVVFMTSDGTEFHVYKLLLGLASPLFKDMFSLKQSSDVNSKPNPIVITEASDTFDALLRLCYPVDDPCLGNLALLERVTEAAMKYQMGEASKICRAQLVQTITGASALSIFATACRLKLEAEAHHAADSWRGWHRINSMLSNFSKTISSTNVTLGQTVTSTEPSTYGFIDTLAGTLYNDTSSISRLSAGIYHRLIYFCQIPAPPAGTLELPSTMTFLSPQNPRASHIQSCQPCVESFTTSFTLSPSDVDITLQSSDGNDFPYHTLLLRLSPIRKILDLSDPLQNPDNASSGEPSLPVMRVPMRGQTLQDLLQMHYPGTYEAIEDPQRLLALTQVAKQYEMEELLLSLRRQINRLLREQPLAMYFLAVENGWRTEAETAAKLLLEHRDLETEYDPIMEDVSASSYHSLLRFHYESLAAIDAAVQQHAPDCSQWRDVTPSSLKATSKPLTVTLALVEREANLKCSHKPYRRVSVGELYQVQEKFNATVEAELAKVWKVICYACGIKAHSRAQGETQSPLRRGVKLERVIMGTSIASSLMSVAPEANI